MDIEINDPRLALMAVGKLFGNDISTGPRRSWPKSLEALSDLPDSDVAEPVRVKLNAPGSGAYWFVWPHRVDIKHKGVLQGYAWRMSDPDIERLNRWETVCNMRGTEHKVVVG